MSSQISIWGLVVSFIPVLVVLFLMWRTEQVLGKSVIAIMRMLLQLLLVGYALVLVFAQPSIIVTLAILLGMVIIATSIALNVSRDNKRKLFGCAFIALLCGGGGVLTVMVFGVLTIEPWYNPRIVLPLAGMTFASSMTAISLSLERFESESVNYPQAVALNKAFKAAMIPVVNSMLAVGVVSLPGMMTGQILAGVEPYIAARYQIMVMCMVFSSTGLTIFIFLKLLSKVESNGAKSDNI